MKTKKDLHIHTNWCDGKDSPEEMVRSAIQVGLETVGILSHSYTWFDESYCLQKDRISDFIHEIHRLKELYGSKIEVLCGIELDYYSDMDVSAFDYTIGSVHYVHPNDGYYAIDSGEKGFIETANTVYDGDYSAFAEDYFKNVGDVIRKTKSRIIGHFDVFSKYNQGNRLFNEQDPRYVKAWHQAVDRLIPEHVPFEINTGVISRGYRDHPYPSPDMIDYIRKSGGSFVLGSDSHNKDTVAFQFEKWEKYL